MVFGTLAVALRLATGEVWLQAAILVVTVMFAYAVVRKLGYVRTRDVARAAQLRFWRRARARRDAVWACLASEGMAFGNGASPGLGVEPVPQAARRWPLARLASEARPPSPPVNKAPAKTGR